MHDEHPEPNLERPADDQSGASRRRPFSVVLWLVLIAGVILIVSFSRDPEGARSRRAEVVLTNILDWVAEGKLERLVILNETTLYITPRPGAPARELPREEFKISISPQVIQPLLAAVLEHNRDRDAEGKTELAFRQTGSLVANLIGMLPWLLVLFLLFRLLRARTIPR